jgi:hypothetical protein
MDRAGALAQSHVQIRLGQSRKLFVLVASLNCHVEDIDPKILGNPPNH